MRNLREKRDPRPSLSLRSGLAASAARSLDEVIVAGVEAYDRLRHLPRLLPIDRSELADESVVARRRILTRLARALRAERNRGRVGHWTYDLNRHIGLSQAYAAERQSLQSSANGGGLTAGQSRSGAKTAVGEAGGDPTSVIRG